MSSVPSRIVLNDLKAFLLKIHQEIKKQVKKTSLQYSANHLRSITPKLYMISIYIAYTICISEITKDDHLTVNILYCSCNCYSSSNILIVMPYDMIIVYPKKK